MFRLELELGNEAMDSHEDVATALEEVAGLVRDYLNSGTIRDINGNTVGHWTLRVPDIDDEQGS